MSILAIVDVETGGFSIEKNAICEIALLIIKDHGVSTIRSERYEELYQYSSLIRPYKRPGSDELVTYKPDAMAINGIKLEDIENAPRVDFVCADLIEVLEKYKPSKFVAHNAKFDWDRLRYLLERFANYKLEIHIKQVVDTLKIFKEALPKLKDSYNIKEDSHRALGDCKTLLKILNHEKNRSLC